MLGKLLDEIFGPEIPMPLMIGIVIFCAAGGIIIASAMALGGFGWFLSGFGPYPIGG